jgi:hypothetical protein
MFEYMLVTLILECITTIHSHTIIGILTKDDQNPELNCVNIKYTVGIYKWCTLEPVFLWPPLLPPTSGLK